MVDLNETPSTDLTEDSRLAPTSFTEKITLLATPAVSSLVLYIKNHPGTHLDELIEEVGIPGDQILGHLSSLKNAGLLRTTPTSDLDAGMVMPVQYAVDVLQIDILLKNFRRQLLGAEGRPEGIHEARPSGHPPLHLWLW